MVEGDLHAVVPIYLKGERIEEIAFVGHLAALAETGALCRASGLTGR